jgi:hypothetical protein
MSSLPAGGRKNYRVVSPEDMKRKKVRPEVKQRLMKKLEPKTPGGDIDPETGDLIPESVENTRHTVHVNVNKTGFRRLERKIASLDGYRESDHSDGRARFYFDANKHGSAERKKAAEFIKNTRGAEFSHAVKESVQKAGHPEAFELGLDKETTSNAEYQKILRRKRIERAAQMSDPNHPTHTDDSSDTTLDDVEAADRAARRRRRIGEAMEKQGMLFKTEPEQKTTTVVPAVVGKDRKRATDQRSRENVKRSKKR